MQYGLSLRGTRRSRTGSMQPVAQVYYDLRVGDFRPAATFQAWLSLQYNTCIRREVADGQRSSCCIVATLSGPHHLQFSIACIMGHRNTRKRSKCASATCASEVVNEVAAAMFTNRLKSHQAVLSTVGVRSDILIYRCSHSRAAM